MKTEESMHKSYQDILLDAYDQDAEAHRQTVERWQKNGLRVWRREHRAHLIHQAIDFVLTVGISLFAILLTLYIVTH
jgi:hypothetical protein